MVRVLCSGITKLGAVGALLLAIVGQAAGQLTSIETRTTAGTPATGWSHDARCTPDGLWLIFASSANNMVPQDTGGFDIFVKQRETGVIRRVSVRADGSEAVANHQHPDLTPDGRFVVFSSDATTLVSPPAAGRQIYLRDRDADGDGVFDEPGAVTLSLVSQTAAGVRASGDCRMPVVSADGRYVAFQSDAANLVSQDANGAMDIFVKDRLTGMIACASRGLSTATGNGGSRVPNISRDGRYVIYHSDATNLVAADTNAVTDVFRYSVGKGLIERVSVSASGGQLDGGSVLGSETVVGPCLTANGEMVVFQSLATNAVPADTNAAIDIFVRDMISGSVSLVSRRTDGSLTTWPSISGSISGDGRYVLFASSARDMVADDTNRRQDLFLRDRDTDANGILDEAGGSTTVRVSVGTEGIQSQSDSYSGRMTDNGQGILFATASGNLVAGDTNGFPDVFFSIRSTRCPADLDSSGSVDGDDVIYFLAAWEIGDIEADVDESGATDGDDIIVFFSRFDAGC